ncbi:MAG: hypothetical protein MUE99_08170, partial [Chitinophagaceae bacterium]|nr:hypothetical protein [Chitinophagaceae bacterium]
ATMKTKLLVYMLFISGMAIAQQRVGINTNAPIESLDVNGNINLRGLIKLNSNPGNNGQVLMSKGASEDPVWTNSAYTGGGRFFCSYNNNSHTLGRQGFTTTSNTSSQEDSIDLLASQVIGSDFTINTTGLTNNYIQINRSGLYNFVGAIRIFATIDDAITMLPRTYVKFKSNQPGGNLDHEIYLDERLMERIAGSSVGSSVNSHNLMAQFNFNIHLAAGTTVTFITGFTGLKYPLSAIGVSQGGYITGHFISD